jgi:putative FmdB family regulatory protein
MPLYEYACAECGHEFETLVMNGERVECPKCHADKLDRLLSLPGRPNVVSGASAMSCPPDGSPCGRMGCNRLNM